MMNSRLKKSVVWVVIICVALLALVSAVGAIQNVIEYSSYDFQYDSFLLYRLRINPYDETLNPTGVADELGLTQYYSRLEANQFASFFALMTPITFLPPLVANAVWCVLNFIWTVLILILVKKLFCPELPNKAFFIVCCLMLIGLGWRNQVGLGQHTLFSLFFFLLAVYLSEKEHRILAGVALAFGLFKYTLTGPLLLYFVYKRKYKELIVPAGIHIGLMVFSSYWLRDSLINLFLKPLKVTSWLGDEGTIDFGTIFKVEGVVPLMLAAIAMLILLCLAIFLSRKQSVMTDTSHDFFALLCYVALVVIYHRSYDFFVWIIPCLIYLYRYYTTRERKGELIVSALLFAYSNYFTKVFAVLTSLVPAVERYEYAFSAGLAFSTYAFIIYLTVSMVIAKKRTQSLEVCKETQ